MSRGQEVIKKNIILVDLDGTLCNPEQRLPFISEGRWEDFRIAIIDDPPYEDVVFFLKKLSGKRSVQDCFVILLTGCPDRYESDVWDWLYKNKLVGYIDHVIMRPEGNNDRSYDMKTMMLDRFFGTRENWVKRTIIMLENRESVVKAFREIGINVWQVRESGY